MLFHLTSAVETPVLEKQGSKRDASFAPRVATAESFLHGMDHDFDMQTLEIGDMNMKNESTSAAHNPPSIGAEMNSDSGCEPGWHPGQLCMLLENRLSFSVHSDDQQTIQEIRNNPGCFFTSSDLQDRYFPFCEDFGPVNLGVVVQFQKFLHGLLSDRRIEGRQIVYYCDNDDESVANTIFLLASFLILDRGFSPAQALAPFESIPGIPVVSFRDATCTASTFPLTVLDCLGGLKKAVDHQWLDIHTFDMDEYLELDDPNTADMHRICPNLYAARSSAQDERENVDCDIPVDAQVQHFRRIGVTRVLRLMTKQELTHHTAKNSDEAKDIDHLYLPFEGNTPSDAEVVGFLQHCSHVDSAPLVVCCRNGLGKTGTMVGVWIMREFGFSAREAIAWMRIVRPGMVLGPQQHYLEQVQMRLAAGTFPFHVDREEMVN